MKKKLLMVIFLMAAKITFAQKVDRVDAIGITVSDMESALAFYTKVLPFTIIDQTEVSGESYEHLKGLFGIRYKKVRLRLGEEEIELTDYLTSGGRAIPEDSKSNDLWFQHIAIVVSDMDSAYARLRKHNILHVSTAPQTLPKTIPAAAGVKAFYFRDPDGHNLELIYFPEGKGDPRWHTKTNQVFLGIDHTAIGINATRQSLQFYDELLGLTRAGDSFNFGVEQEHLNNVFGASLHITGNKGISGPGVEFLEYLTPKTGRPYPEDSRADDLVHWETVFVTHELDQLFAKLKSTDVKFISPAIVSIGDEKYLYDRGFYIRDPDGHVVGIFERR
ncbi:MAG TPA: VOC family protein [Cyclobacteriaceae bacterium]|nr:VOC family protein [Cyclobacteriaceae bacterium]